MSQTPRSLKHEYELFVEQEIENYKDSISRSALLAIGDEAAAALAAQAQLALTELLLWEEVDRIIARRLALPSYQQWRRKRLKLLAEYRRPEHWGMTADDAVVRTIPAGESAHVLVAVGAEGAALYLAAHGCDVTALGMHEEEVERVMQAAVQAGLAGRLRGQIGGLAHWAPEAPLSAVVCTPAAFTGLSDAERARVIAELQGATADGGVHLVQTILAGHTAVTLDELQSRYRGWSTTVERSGALGGCFVARKASA